MTDFESTETTGYRRSTRLALAASALWTVMPATPVEAMAPVEEGAGPSGRPDLPSDPRLRIEISETVDDTDLLYEWIVGRSLDVVKTNVPLVEENEQWVAVEIDGTTYDYRVSAVAMRDGEPVGSPSEPVVCVCNSDELLSLVDDRIAAAAQALQEVPVTIPVVAIPPSPALVSSLETGSDLPPERGSTAPESKQDDRRNLGAMGYTGIGVGVAGAGTLGAGIALILRPDRMRGPAGTARRLSTHTPGIVMAAGGGVAVAASMVLIAVDLARPRGRSISLAPTFDAYHVGLSLGRTF